MYVQKSMQMAEIVLIILCGNLTKKYWKIKVSKIK